MPTAEEVQAAQAVIDAEKAAQKVTFDDRQQAKITELIQEAMGRAGRDRAAEAASAKAELATVKTELDAAKAALAAAKTPGQKKEAAGDIEALQAQINEMKNVAENYKAEVQRAKDDAALRAKEVLDARKEAVEVRKSSAILSAASKYGFVDVAEVAQLTASSIDYNAETGQLFVKGENGPRLNNSFEPMSLEEFYAEYAHKKPYMVRGDVRGGAGSTAASQPTLSSDGKYDVKTLFGKGSDAGAANALAMKNPQEYKRLKAVAIANGIISI